MFLGPIDHVPIVIPRVASRRRRSSSGRRRRGSRGCAGRVGHGSVMVTEAVARRLLIDKDGGVNGPGE